MRLRSPKTKRPKLVVFVVMPFAKTFDNVYFAIERAGKDAGAVVTRVDQQIFPWPIQEQIHGQIAEADVVVADLTEQSANVFYEIGYAHALKKYVIHLAQEKKDIPFDLQNFQHVIYGGSDNNRDLKLLATELLKRFKQVIASLTTAAEEPQPQLQLEIEGKRLADRPTIEVNPFGKWSSQLAFTLDIRNVDASRPAEFKLAVLTSEALSSMEASSPSNPRARRGRPDRIYSTSTSIEGQSRRRHSIRDQFRLMPDEQESLRLQFSHHGQPGQTEEVVFRILTDSGEQSHPCLLEIGG